MVDIGRRSPWDGPIEHTPWWWPFALQISKRIQSLQETAAYDPDKKPPPKDLLPLSRSDDLDGYLEERRQENERRLKTQQPLD